MNDGPWTMEWEHVSPSEVTKDSPPPSLIETASAYYAMDSVHRDSTESFAYNDSDHNSPLTAFAHRVSPASQRVDSHDDWEASLVMAEKYWQSPHENGTTATLHAANASSPCILHREDHAAVGGEGGAAHTFPSPQPEIDHDSGEEKEQTDTLTSLEHLYSGYLAGGAHDTSFSATHTSSTVLVMHGDFSLTARAQCLLDQRCSRGLPPSAAQGTTSDDGAMLMARGTLIVKSNGAGCLLDWRPSFALESSQTYSCPPPLAQEFVAPSEGSPCTVKSAPFHLPPTRSQTAAAPACVPQHRSPAWTHGDSPGPPCCTTQTVPRRSVLPDVLPPSVARCAAAVSAEPRKVSSAPLLPTLPPKTPPALSAHRAVLRKNSVTGTFEGLFVTHPKQSSDSDGGSELPSSGTCAQQQNAQKRGSAPPKAPTPLVEAVAVQCRSPAQPGSASRYRPQPPALPLPRATTSLRSSKGDIRDSLPPLPPSSSPPQPSPSLETVSSGPSSWVLLDSSSEESNSAVSSTVKSLARMVETAEGDAGNTVITLQPVSSSLQLESSTSNSSDVSKQSFPSPTRSGHDVEEIGTRVTSLADAQQQLLGDQEGDAKKGKKPLRGRHDSTGLTRGIPVSVNAVAASYDYTGRINEGNASASLSGSADSCWLQLEGGASSLNNNGRPLPVLKVEESGSTVAVPNAPPSSVSVKEPQHAKPSAGVNVEPHAEDHQSQPKEGVACEIICLRETNNARGDAAGNNDREELTNAEVQSADRENGKGASRAANNVEAANMRDEAMSAFPSIPMTERLSPMGEVAMKAAQSHSPATVLFRGDEPPQLAQVGKHPIEGLKVSVLQEELQRQQRESQQRAEALQATLPRKSDSSPQRDRRMRSLAPLRKANGLRGAAREYAKAIVSAESNESEAANVCASPPSPPARQKENGLRDGESGGSTAVGANKGVGAPARRTSKVTFSSLNYIVTTKETDAGVASSQHQGARFPANEAGAAKNCALDLSTSSTQMDDSAPGVSLSHSDDLPDPHRGRALESVLLRRGRR